VGPVLSSLWFPPNQRATATAVAMISGFGGAAGCFALGKTWTHVIRLWDNIGKVTLMWHSFVLLCQLEIVQQYTWVLRF